MKQHVFFLFTMISFCTFSQQILQKTFETSLNEIELTTFGLDEVKIMNTNSDIIEISLYDENLNTHAINIKETSIALKIDFELPFKEESAVFKKFITKRLHRASVILKIPKNKKITLYGSHVDVISESYQGDLNIYIDKGLVKLHKVYGDIILKLFQGNVFAQLFNTNINIVSNHGKIIVNDTLHQKKYQKVIKKSKKQFKLNTINANMTLFSNF